MAASNEFAAHCVELLSPLGAARARRMFGGHGFYVDDLFVAVGSGDRLYLKVNDASRPQFEAAGCVPFEFEGREGRKVVLGFWSAPDEALESPMLMQPWARLAMQAALQARNAKPVKKVASKAVGARKTRVSPAPATARPTGASAPKAARKTAPKR